MIIRVNFLFFGLLFFISSPLQINGLHSAPSPYNLFNKLTLTKQVNEKVFIMVRLIEDTSVLEVTLLNNTKKPIAFVESFNLNDIEIELRNNFRGLVKERQKNQTEDRNDIILKSNDGSRQIVSVPAGEKKVIAKLNIKSRFELTSGTYYAVVKKSIWLEGKDYEVIKSAPLKIKL